MALRHSRSVVGAAFITAVASGATIYGSPAAHADLIEDGPQLIAHRGGYDYGTENSVRTLRKAFERGADAVEFDVQWTKDGRTVVMHDSTMNRTSNCSGTVTQITYKKYRSCELNDGTTAPSIYDVLKVAKDYPKSHVYVHVRGLTTWDKGKKISLALERNGLNNERRATIITDSKTALYKAKQAGFEGRRGYMFRDSSGWNANYHTLIPWNTTVTRAKVAAAQKRGKEVVVVEGHPTKLSGVRSMGLDGFMSNNLGAALDLLGRTLDEVTRQLSELSD